MSSLEQMAMAAACNRDNDMSRSQTSFQDIDADCVSFQSAPRSQQVKRPRRLQVQADLQHHSYSDIELVYILRDRKFKGGFGSAMSKLKTIDWTVCIKELDAAVEMHPIHILRALGINPTLTCTKPLQACYFSSETRYTSKKAAFTRNRSMVTSDEVCCWSQGGGMTSVMDRENMTLGVRRNFTFSHKPSSLGKKYEVLGSNVYTFQLHELALAGDLKQEKIRKSGKQTPLKFVCMYRLIPVMQQKGLDLTFMSSLSQHQKDQLAMHRLTQPQVDGPSLAPVSSELLVENTTLPKSAQTGPVPLQVILMVEDAPTHGSTEGGPNLATPILIEVELDLELEPTETRHDLSRAMEDRPEYDSVSSLGELLAPNGTTQSSEFSIGTLLAQVFVQVCTARSNDADLVGLSEVSRASAVGGHGLTGAIPAAGQEIVAGTVLPQASHKLQRGSGLESGSRAQQPTESEHPTDPPHTECLSVTYANSCVASGVTSQARMTVLESQSSNQSNLKNMSGQLAIGRMDPYTHEVQSNLHNQNPATQASWPDVEATSSQEQLYFPEEWNSPQLIFIPGHAERFDREWMGPFKKT